MKIIQVCAAYKPAYIYGGPTMSMSKLAEELVKAKQDVTVLVTTANGKEELPIKPGTKQIVDGVSVYYFKRITKDHTHFSPALLFHLYKMIRDEEKNSTKKQLVIHIHAWWNLVSIFSCLIAKVKGVKVLLSPRGMLTNYSLSNRNSKAKDIIHQLVGKSLLNKTFIHATSNQEVTDVQLTCKTGTFFTIPNFVRFPKNVVRLSAENQPFKIIFISRVEQKKGLELLFSSLVNVSFNFELTIAGTGEESYISSLQNLAKDLGLTNRLKWLGHVSNDKKFELIAQHQLCALTSYNENFANIVIESLAVGTPVLISNKVGLADYVTKNNVGWVCDLVIEDITKCLNDSFNQTEKRLFINSHSPKLINEDFSEQKLVQHYINAYNKITS